jgi:hypothetical protein
LLRDLTLGRVALGVALATAGLIALGWIATIAVALLLPGGHPPPSAYPAAAVMLASLLLAPIGLVLGALALRERRAGRLTAGAWAVGFAFSGNALWVLLGLQIALGR